MVPRSKLNFPGVIFLDWNRSQHVRCDWTDADNTDKLIPVALALVQTVLPTLPWYDPRQYCSSSNAKKLSMEKNILFT